MQAFLEDYLLWYRTCCFIFDFHYAVEIIGLSISCWNLTTQPLIFDPVNIKLFFEDSFIKITYVPNVCQIFHPVWGMSLLKDQSIILAIYTYDDNQAFLVCIQIY